MSEASDTEGTFDTLTLLTDALARSRLTIAEIAGLEPLELEALYALIRQKLQAKLFVPALTLLKALITLAPYNAKYWRLYGQIWQHLQQFLAARKAYQAALLLAPADLLTQQALESLNQPPKPPLSLTKPPPPLTHAERFTLRDGRPLPLKELTNITSQITQTEVIAHRTTQKLLKTPKTLLAPETAPANFAAEPTRNTAIARRRARLPLFDEHTGVVEIPHEPS